MKQFSGKTKDRFTLGIDIGTHTIKAVKLKIAKDNKASICDYYLEPIQMDLEQVLKKISTASQVKNAVVSVSGLSVILRYIDFPKMNDAELRQALKFEAQKHIPFSLNEVNLDGYILNSSLPDNKMLVLLAAAKKDFINQRVKVVEGSGLFINLIDIDSLAVINAFLFNYGQQENVKTKTVALLNIGSAFSNLNILESGVPRLSRDIHIGGSNITQRIADATGENFKVAEELKINSAIKKAKDFAAAIDLVLSNLASEVRTSFDYYESQSASSVEKIFLSGGGSLLAGLKEKLSSYIGIEVEIWDTFSQISTENITETDKLKEKAAQLAVATGLALRG